MKITDYLKSSDWLSPRKFSKQEAMIDYFLATKGTLSKRGYARRWHWSSSTTNRFIDNALFGTDNGTPKTKKISKSQENVAQQVVQPEITLFTRCRRIFEAEFKRRNKQDYYFEAKDAKALKTLLMKLTKARKEKGLTSTDEELLNAFEVFITKINGKWLEDNFTLTVINSQYNNILSSIRNENNRSTDKQKRDEDYAAYMQKQLSETR